MSKPIMKFLIKGLITLSPVLIVGIIKSLLVRDAVIILISLPLYLVGAIFMAFFYYYYEVIFTPKRINKIFKRKEFLELEKIGFKRHANGMSGIYRDYNCAFKWSAYSENFYIKGASLDAFIGLDLDKTQAIELYENNKQSSFLWFKDGLLISLTSDFRTPSKQIMKMVDEKIDSLKREGIKTKALDGYFKFKNIND